MKRPTRLSYKYLRAIRCLRSSIQSFVYIGICYIKTICTSQNEKRQVRKLEPMIMKHRYNERDEEKGVYKVEDIVIYTLIIMLKLASGIWNLASEENIKQVRVYI